MHGLATSLFRDLATNCGIAIWSTGSFSRRRMPWKTLDRRSLRRARPRPDPPHVRRQGHLLRRRHLRDRHPRRIRYSRRTHRVRRISRPPAASNGPIPVTAPTVSWCRCPTGRCRNVAVDDPDEMATGPARPYRGGTAFGKSRAGEARADWMPSRPFRTLALTRMKELRHVLAEADSAVVILFALSRLAARARSGRRSPRGGRASPLSRRDLAARSPFPERMASLARVLPAGRGDGDLFHFRCRFRLVRPGLGAPAGRRLPGGLVLAAGAARRAAATARRVVLACWRPPSTGRRRCHSILVPISRSMASMYLVSDLVAMVKDLPERPARPVRPMRWT